MQENLLILNEKEKQELTEMMENYYDDEVERASESFPGIRRKLKEAQPLDQKELKILSLCLKRDIEDFYQQAEQGRQSKIYENIYAKIMQLIA